MSTAATRHLLVARPRQVPAVERRQRHEVDQTDEDRHEREEVEDRRPSRLVDDVAPTCWLIPTTLVASCWSRGASLVRSVTIRPIPWGPNTRPDLPDRLLDREADLLHPGDDRGHEPDPLGTQDDPDPSHRHALDRVELRHDLEWITCPSRCTTTAIGEFGWSVTAPVTSSRIWSWVGFLTSPTLTITSPGRIPASAAGEEEPFRVASTLPTTGTVLRKSPKKKKVSENRSAATMKCDPGPAKIVSARWYAGFAP